MSVICCIENHGNNLESICAGCFRELEIEKAAMERVVEAAKYSCFNYCGKEDYHKNRAICSHCRKLKDSLIALDRLRGKDGEAK